MRLSLGGQKSLRWKRGQSDFTVPNYADKGTNCDKSLLECVKTMVPSLGSNRQDWPGNTEIICFFQPKPAEEAGRFYSQSPSPFEKPFCFGPTIPAPLYFHSIHKASLRCSKCFLLLILLILVGSRTGS